jgi:glutathione S-transferase
MKLYFAPHMASLAPLIVTLECNLIIDLIKVDMETKLVSSGGTLAGINPKNMLPVLVMGDGETLTETPAILIYLAGLSDTISLLPQADSLRYYRVMGWLSYFSSELHKLFTLHFWAECPEMKIPVTARILAKFDFLENAIGDTYLVGEQYSLADIYFYINACALSLIGKNVVNYPKLSKLAALVESRPAVKAALKRHGDSD